MQDDVAQSFVRLLEPALRQAAGIARALEGRVENRPKAGALSPAKAALTVADTATQEALLVPLGEHFPGVRVEAEEDTPGIRRFPQESDSLVVVDPIDGTLRFYLEGGGPYAILVGLAVRDRYEAALVALPREGLFLDAVRGGPARIAGVGEAPRPARPSGDGTRVLVSHDMPGGVCDRLRERGYRPEPACGGAIAVAPLVPGCCGGLRRVATPAGISRQGRIGALVSAEAGAIVEASGGRPFPDPIGVPEPILLVAGSEEHAEALRWALAAEPDYIPV